MHIHIFFITCTFILQLKSNKVRMRSKTNKYKYKIIHLILMITFESFAPNGMCFCVKNKNENETRFGWEYTIHDIMYATVHQGVNHIVFILILIQKGKISTYYCTSMSSDRQSYLQISYTNITEMKVNIYLPYISHLQMPQFHAKSRVETKTNSECILFIHHSIFHFIYGTAAFHGQSSLLLYLTLLMLIMLGKAKCWIGLQSHL